MKIVVDRALAGADRRLLNLLIISLFGIQALKIGVSWITNYLFNAFSLEVITDIKKDLFHKILKLPISFFEKYQTGYLMSRMGEVDNLSFFFSSTLIYIAVSAGQFLFCLAIPFHLNANLTVSSLLLLPLFYMAARFSKKNLRQLSKQYYESFADLTKGLQDSLSGVEAVESFSAEQRETRRFLNKPNYVKAISLKKALSMSLYREVFSFIAAGAGFIILWIGGGKIIGGSFTLGSYLAFSAYFGQLFGPTQLIANMSITLQPAKVALVRIPELIKLVTEDKRGGSPIKQPCEGRIDVSGAKFGYVPDKLVLDAVNLSVLLGEKVLIAGPNGSG